ncbi:MAG: hypothetical protein GY899_18415 [Verrucomicrobiaceae bacterium]|nr:hypothetical protein [Verrucomicrobiaceae bacterium]
MLESSGHAKGDSVRRNAGVIARYRGFVARVCILAGCLAVGMGVYQVWIGQNGGALQGKSFYWDWVKVLAVVLIFAIAMWWRLVRATGLPFWSKGMRRVVIAFFPSLLAGAVVSYEIVAGYDEFELCALCWVMCYGAGLLSVRQIAPRSLRGPGWAFLIAGALITFFWSRYGAALAPQLGVGEAESAAGIMVLSFGLLHLVHGVALLLGKGNKRGMS